MYYFGLNDKKKIDIENINNFNLFFYREKNSIFM